MTSTLAPFELLAGLIPFGILAGCVVLLLLLREDQDHSP